MAETLGQSLDEIDAMPIDRFMEWMAFDAVEPIGQRRIDIKIAELQAMLANIHRDSRLHPRPYSFKDFLPSWYVAPEKRIILTPEEQLERMLLAQQMQNAT